MPVGRRTGVATALACLGLAGLGSGTALGAPAEIVAADRCCTFVDGPFEQPRGEVASFVNPETADAPHNVESTQDGPDGMPLFYSRTLRAGEQTAVRGTQYLQAGRYPFVCSLHASAMTGELEITDAGAAVERPSVRLTIPAQRLRAVTRKRVLRMTVNSPTGVSGGSLQARIGKRAVGKRIRLNLAAGKRLRATFKIPAKLSRSMKRKRSIVMSADAQVPFGSPAKIQRVIR
jgi:hypothetical protein